MKTKTVSRGGAETRLKPFKFQFFFFFFFFLHLRGSARVSWLTERQGRFNRLLALRVGSVGQRLGVSPLAGRPTRQALPLACAARW